MSINEFSGLCIGGPYDGQMMASNSIFLTAMKTTGPRWGEVKWGEAMWKRERFNYTFLNLWGINDRGFWIPSTEADNGVTSAMMYVMDKLCGRYAGTDDGDGGVAG